MLCSSVGNSAEIPPSDDALKIRFIFYKETEHAFTPSQDVHESCLIRQSEKVIKVCLSELCNQDASIMQSYSVRMIVDIINTHFPASRKEEERPKVVAGIIDLVQKSIDSIPLPANRVIDVERCEVIKILHHVSDEVNNARLLCYFEATRCGTCVICLDDFEFGRNTSRLPCLHVFHGTCIFSWLLINNECPVCRYSLLPKLVTWF